jgi:elongation factor Tu
MPIDGIYVITGRGTVVTGKIETGKILLNDNIELVGKSIFKVTCMGIEMYKKSLETGEAGENVGILIKGNIDRKKINKGDVLATTGSIKSLKKFEAKVYILTPEEGGRRTAFSVKYKPQFFFRTSNVTGQVILPDYRPLVLPGDSVVFNVELIENSPLNVGLRFAIREGRVTVGAGIITKLY